MQEIVFKAAFIALMAVAMFGRIGFARKIRSMEVVVSRKSLLEIFLLAVSSFIMLAPLVYVFTGWLDAWNLALPGWARIIGLAGFAVAVFMHNWSHAALGLNWSPTLEIKKKQSLVTTGPYKHVRHPMYTGFWLWVLFQGVLLSNSAVMVLGIGSFALIYFLRVDGEEKMMLERFGKEYRDYMKRTGRLLPKIF